MSEAGLGAALTLPQEDGDDVEKAFAKVIFLSCRFVVGSRVLYALAPCTNALISGSSSSAKRRFAAGR